MKEDFFLIISIKHTHCRKCHQYKTVSQTPCVCGALLPCPRLGLLLGTSWHNQTAAPTPLRRPHSEPLLPDPRLLDAREVIVSKENSGCFAWYEYLVQREINCLWTGRLQSQSGRNSVLSRYHWIYPEHMKEETQCETHIYFRVAALPKCTCMRLIG